MDTTPTKPEGSNVTVFVERALFNSAFTFIRGLPKDMDFQNLLTRLQKEFGCAGYIDDHPTYGRVIRLKLAAPKQVVKYLTTLGIHATEQ